MLRHRYTHGHGLVRDLSEAPIILVYPQITSTGAVMAVGVP